MKRAILGIAGVVVAALVVCSTPSIPDFAAVKGGYRSSDLVVEGADGAVLQELRVAHEVRRFHWVELGAVPPEVRAAVIYAEDRRFTTHAGVDWRALGSAVLSGGGRGASTISMQVASLVETDAPRTAGHRRTVVEKVRQIRRALALEGRWSKDQILEAYLNLIPFRGESEGLAGAARLIFGKSVENLTPDEAVLIAVLIRAPNASPAALEERGCRLKTALLGAGLARFALPSCERITEIARAIGAGGASAGRFQRVNDAPHVARLLADRSPERRLVRTTLDAPLQRFVNEQLRAQLAVLDASNVADGAALVVDNDTGAVLAYVGNGGIESSARFVDGVRARRQAGSTLKPFLYGLAIERRLLAADTLLNDAPLDVPVGVGVYRPKNYDGTFKGLVSARTALASSLNIPAVLTVQRVGVAPFVELLGKLRFEGLQRADIYGPSVALGSPAVSLWDLVNGYRTLARGGVVSDLRLISSGEDAPAVPVLDRGAAFIVADILADRASRSATFGLENSLATPYWTAVKTGTSKDMTDNWCVGFSRQYTVGVWVGNFSGAPMHDVSGVTGAAPLWARIFDFLAQRRDFIATPPPVPSDLVVRVRGGHRAVYLPGTEPVEQVAPINPKFRPEVILAPVEGEIFAIDPDIPAANQKVIFRRSGGERGGRWFLNGAPLGPADAPYLWSPEPGSHTVSLRSEAGTVLGTVRFSVRGKG